MALGSTDKEDCFQQVVLWKKERKASVGKETFPFFPARSFGWSNN